MSKILLIFTITFSFAYESMANILAILDSGVDYQHQTLVDHMWKNPGEIDGNRRDDDGNGFRDDFYGWNFAGGNNQVINYKYLGKFTDKPVKFLSIQNKVLRGIASAEEKAWLKGIREDKDFIKEMQIFGNFAHGTHVARISSRIADDSEVMALKLLPTEIGETASLLRKFAVQSEDLYDSSLSTQSKGKKAGKLLESALKLLAETQASQISESFHYIGNMNASVMNGSFGTSYNAIKMITDNAFKIFKLRKPSDEESLATVRMYFKYNLDALSKTMAKYPKTLFVFAAGNEGLNNDIKPASPASVRLPNVVTVAATIDSESLAVFSNFGASTVDIAAPGVGIVSAIPTPTHSDKAMMSGTSQAAPYVAGVAAKIRSINPDLTAAETRKILMGTVDQKEFLFRKVSSDGLVNSDRAFLAAEMSLKMSLDKAILRSYEKAPELMAASFPVINKKQAVTKEELKEIAPLLKQELVKVDEKELSDIADQFLKKMKN